MQAAANLFEGIPEDLPEEHFAQLFRGVRVRIERIVSQGHHSPEGFWYDQDDDEWVLVLEGSAAVQFEESPQPVELRRGDYLHIPARARHRVVWTDPTQRTVWLAIHSGP